ncbi:hypothetical protein ABIE27_003303 [Paenibacillus sp. 4624]|uniref:Copper amine oxidase n=1 Tax=Paenibacillus amylolyticus TaxID=1451 RepID=A0A5M9WNR8_PAEAM|nr:hypothetical protein [Paenibacillus amylolyticus]KAA8783242.1 hypothetical protein EC604_05200 [Paenibacillus amylolyticus]
MKTWTGILLMIILAVATLSVTSTAKTTNESQQQLNIDESSSQAVAAEASHIDRMNDAVSNNKEMMQVQADDVSVAPENNDVRVYPMSVEGSGYIYNGLVVEANGKKREFSDWRAEGGSYKPEVHELDLNGDGKKEIVVLYSEGHGTGIYLGQAHILDPVTLEVMKMQTLDEIVKEHVESKVTTGSDQINIDITVDGVPAESSNVEKGAGDGLYNDKLQFGRVTYYSVESGKLVVSTSGAYGEGLYAGDLTFSYVFQDGEWKANDLKYSMEVYEEEYYESFD